MILFCPEVDTHVHMFAPVARRLNCSYRFLSRPPIYDTLSLLDLPSVAWFINEAKLIVLGNDWGPYGRNLMRQGIPSIVIQEGPLNFNHLNQLRGADYAIGQGNVTLKYRPEADILGNPRYDLYCRRAQSDCLVMINVNFTYGIYEEVRNDWVMQAKSACDALGKPYFLSQHPRDRGDIGRAIASNAGNIHRQLAMSDILITRYSSLIYEGLLSGCKVIYFNPHGESMAPFENGLPIPVPTTVRELKSALDADYEYPKDWLDYHCRPGKSAPRIARHLEELCEHL